MPLPNFNILFRFENAAYWFHRTLLYNSNHEDALLFLGLYHHQSGRSQIALPYFRKLVEIDPRNAQNIYYLGLALQHSGKVAYSCIRTVHQITSACTAICGRQKLPPVGKTCALINITASCIIPT